MQLQARPVAGHIVGNSNVEGVKMHVLQHRAVSLPKRVGRSQMAVFAAEQNTGLTSNSSLLGPSSVNLGGPSLGSGLNSSAKPAVSLANVPLDSTVSSDQHEEFRLERLKCLNTFLIS